MGSNNNYTVVNGLRPDMLPGIGPVSFTKIIIEKNDNAEGIIEFDTAGLDLKGNYTDSVDHGKPGCVVVKTLTAVRDPGLRSHIKTLLHEAPVHTCIPVSFPLRSFSSQCEITPRCKHFPTKSIKQALMTLDET